MLNPLAGEHPPAQNYQYVLVSAPCVASSTKSLWIASDMQLLIYRRCDTLEVDRAPLLWLC